MQAIILWTGIEYHSMEHCHLHTAVAGTTVTVQIVGAYTDQLYQMQYTIEISPEWQAINVTLYYTINGRDQQLSLAHTGQAQWLVNGQPEPTLDGCTDIDLSLSPFTNTLLINRLQLPIGQSAEIQVVYTDLLNEKLRPARQRYTRLGNHQYR